jgi:hypothetical protein
MLAFARGGKMPRSSPYRIALSDEERSELEVRARRYTSPSRPAGSWTLRPRWNGQPLGRREFVISADEETSIQARVRRHTTTPPAPGQPMRVEDGRRLRAGRLAEQLCGAHYNRWRPAGRPRLNDYCTTTGAVRSPRRWIADAFDLRAAAAAAG